MAEMIDEAFVDLDNALAIQPDSAFAHLYLGQASEIKGDYIRAADYYEKASDLAEEQGLPQLQVIARMSLAQVLQQFTVPTPPGSNP